MAKLTKARPYTREELVCSKRELERELDLLQGALPFLALEPSTIEGEEIVFGPEHGFSEGEGYRFQLFGSARACAGYVLETYTFPDRRDQKAIRYLDEAHGSAQATSSLLHKNSYYSRCNALAKLLRRRNQILNAEREAREAARQ
jgi:hypothetical protein